MASARIFKSGNSQAVRLPKEFRFDSEEVEIFRRGDEVVLREKSKGMARAFELIASLPIEDLAGDRDEPPQEPEGL
jgi:antitoxin VapB